MPYAIQFKPAALRQIEKVEPGAQKRILSRIEMLSQDPLPQGCRELSPLPNAWRIRIGSYRVIYQVHHGRLAVHRHRPSAGNLPIVLPACTYAALSVSSVISGGTPRRTGMPKVPRPRLTYSAAVFAAVPSPASPLPACPLFPAAKPFPIGSR